MNDTTTKTSHAPGHAPGRRRALLLAGLTAILAVGLIACSDTEDGDTAASGEDGDNVPSASVEAGQPETQGTAVPHVTVEAEILNNASKDVEIHAQDSILWTNNDDEARTISGDGIESTTIEPGETYSHTFTDEGTYEVDIEGGESFTVTVLSSLRPETQGTGVPRPQDATPASGN